jgi:succinate-semialdehyde dehydrogenase/glutarate-semialdehyde dehydrogenase
MIQSINPYNGEILSEFEFYTDKEILNAIEDAAKAYKHWRRSKYENRHELLQNVANLLKQNKQYYAELITREMGKPIDQSYAEIEKCAAMTSFYAERFDDFLQHQIIETKHLRSFVAYEPLGIVFSIMPWNFPFWQALRCAVPTIAAGNCYMLKHAPNVSLCAIELQKLFIQAGFDKGVFTTIFAEIPQVSSIISHDAIVGVSLTGSEKAGISVATIAGQNLKKCVLELGGSDPCIIFEDANLEKATFAAVRSRMNNSGQTCIAAKRIFLQQSIYEVAIEKLSSIIQGLKVGNPMENGTDIGPLARPDLRILLDNQVEQSVKNGANSIITAGSISSDYCFFKPGLYDNIQKGQAFEDEEIFGPVMTVFPFEDVEDVILMSNNSRYGLGASIWTQDYERAEYIGAHIDVGTIAINNIVRSDMQLPFGGVKKSGYGRELGEMGIREFTNVKTYFLE